MDIVEKARIFATAAHAAVGQKRKYSGDDYIVHPARVADMVTEAGGSPQMIAAAWLHDVIEDTAVTGPQILSEFGPTVFKFVLELTDTSKPEDGNRATRKAIDARRLSFASPEAQEIKLADLIDNSQDIVHNDPSFARVFLKEKAQLLEVMTRANTSPLWDQAQEMVKEPA